MKLLTNMQRYDQTIDEFDKSMVPCDDGEYVKYDDIVKLELIANDLVRALELVRLNSVAWHFYLTEETKRSVADALRKSGVV